jgi:hypothetical protein
MLITARCCCMLTQVDLLLMEWEATVAALEKAELTKERTGREPLKLDSARCGKLLTCCPGACGCAGCHSYTICLEACCGRSHMKPIIPELLVSCKPLGLCTVWLAAGVSLCTDCTSRCGCTKSARYNTKASLQSGEYQLQLVYSSCSLSTHVM